MFTAIIKDLIGRFGNIIIVALVAIVEVLAPGVRGEAGALFAGPVPFRSKGVFRVGVKQGGLLSGGQLDADGCGPCDGFVPRKAGFELMGKKD